MSNRRQILIYSLLIFCFACEVLCSTFLIKPEGDIFKAGGDKIFFSFDNNNFVSILYFLGGIGVAILPLLSVKGALYKTPAKYNRVIVFAVSAMAILLFSFGIYYMVKAFIQHPVDFHYADMLPIMKAQ